MSKSQPTFLKPRPVERIFNRLFGLLVGLGLGMQHNYLLQVQGRSSGKTYSTPVYVLDYRGRRFLVAPRGETQWVRNARAGGQVKLKKGWRSESCRVRAVPDGEKPQLLKAYLDAFKSTVQRYFTIPAGSAPEAFASVASQYPVFEVLP